VIGIAIGTVLLPEMSRRIASGDQAGASASQRQAFDFTLLLSVRSCCLHHSSRCHHARDVRAWCVFESRRGGRRRDARRLCVRAHSVRADKERVATFYARKDTATPVKAALTGVAVKRRAENPPGRRVGAGRWRWRPRSG